VWVDILTSDATLGDAFQAV